MWPVLEPGFAVSCEAQEVRSRARAGSEGGAAIVDLRLEPAQAPPPHTHTLPSLHNNPGCAGTSQSSRAVFGLEEGAMDSQRPGETRPGGIPAPTPVALAPKALASPSSWQTGLRVYQPHGKH